MKRARMFFCVVAGLGIMAGSVGAKPLGKGQRRGMQAETVVIADPYKEAVDGILNAIAEKEEALARIDAAIEQEQPAVQALISTKESRNLDDLKARDIFQSAANISQSAARQRKIKRDLVKSIEYLEKSLDLLGWEAPLSPEPVAHWKFDEGDGKTAYDSVGKNHGKIHGAKWAAGKFGGALSFDGLKDYVDCGKDDSLDITDELTVSAWMKRSSFSTHGVVAGKNNGNSVTAGYGLFSYKQGLEFNFYSSQKWRRTIPRVAVTANQWHHVVGTFNGNIAYLYVDGEQRASLAHNGDITTAAGYPVRIAYWRSRNTAYFNGSVGEVRIHNRALSAQEVKRLYRSQVAVYQEPPAPSEPIAYWKFDEGGGNRAYDSVGKNHGKIHGATWTTGQAGGALSFDGQDDYVSGSTSPFDFANTTFTVSARFKRSGAEHGVIVSEGGKYSGWFLASSSTGQINVMIKKSNGHDAYRAITKDAYANGQWHHVAAVITTDTSGPSGNKADIYVDGTFVDVAERKAGAYGASAKGWTIGMRDAEYNIFFKGMIDDVRIYDRALDSDEIASLKEFVLIPAGQWRAVDFVKEIEDFKPGKKQWTSDLYLKGLTFYKDGRTSGPWTWEKGWLWHPGDKTKARYIIKEIDGSSYLFMEWISGDVTIRRQKPRYYVMQKASDHVGFIVSFKSIEPFEPRTAGELLNSFTERHWQGARTHHFRTQIQGGKLTGHICVDNDADKKSLAVALERSGKLTLVKIRAVTQKEFEEHCRLGQPSLPPLAIPSGGSPVVFAGNLPVDGIVVRQSHCTAEFVESLLGKPRKKDGSMLRYTDSGIDFCFPRNGPLAEIHLNRGFKGKLDTGISLTSTKQDVFGAYGEPVEIIRTANLHQAKGQRVLRQNGNVSRIYYGNEGLIFWFRDDSVIQIVVFKGRMKSSDSNPILSDSLVGHWKLDKGRKKRAYDSVGKNHGKIHGAKWVEGNFGDALDFDGSDDYVYVDHTIVDPGDTSFSVLAWARLDNKLANDLQVIVQQKDSGGDNGRTLLLRRSDDKLGTHLGASGLSSSATVFGDTGVWRHVGLVYDKDASTATLYVDGQKDIVHENCVGESTTGGYLFGSLKNARVRMWDGLIDDVRIYDRALDSDEVASLADVGPSLVAHWTFDDNLNDHASDNNGIGHQMGAGVTYVEGIFGEACDFNGVGNWHGVEPSSFIEIDGSGTYNEYSISVWFKTGNDNYWAFFSDAHAAGSHTHGRPEMGTYGGRVYVVGSDTGLPGPELRLFSRSGYGDDQWHHAVGIGDSVSNQVELYVDGKYVGLNGLGDVYPLILDNGGTPDTRCEIGARSRKKKYYVGQVDDMRIYSGKISASKVRQLYTAGSK